MSAPDAGLGISLYEEAVEHCFGGPSQTKGDIAVKIGDHSVGNQRFRLIAPGVAFKITAFEGRLDRFEIQARRMLSHVDLRAIAWVNINVKAVTLITLER